MRTRFAIALLLAILSIAFLPPVTPAQTSAPVTTSSLIVKVVSGLTSDQQAAIVARNGGTLTSSIPALRLLIVSASTSDLSAILASYQADPQVQSVEENKVRASESVPSDLLYVSQWALPKIGWDQVFGVVTPTGSAKVALLDTGVDAAHPELTDKVLAGTSILDGSNGMTDPSGHGTWLAGIIAAQTNTIPGDGIAGVAYAGVKILPVTVLNANGEGQDSDVIAGVIWAVDHGADVILMAFSNPGFSPNLQDAIDYAWSKNVVVVAAVGNNASAEPTFPAGVRGVMGVAATDQNDGLAWFSNAGQAVFIAAPGVDIQTIDLGDAYTVISGTSTSAAIVAGSAALMKAVDPTLTNGIIVGRLARNADPAGTPAETGNGRVNLPRALADTSVEPVQPAGAAPVGTGGPYVGPYIAAASAITLSPTFGPAAGGTVVTVNGTGFNKNKSIAFKFAGNPITPNPNPCVSDNGGDFICAITTPPSTTGDKAVTADDGNGPIATAQFGVVAIQLSQTSSTYGTAVSSVTVTGQGFNNNRSVSVTFNGITTPCSSNVNNSGNLVGCSFAVAATTPAGTYTATAAETSGNANSRRSATALFTVGKATPTIDWNNPAGITYGTALSATQLNATATAIVGGAAVTITGTFAYTPATGTVLPTGPNQNLHVDFTATDANFTNASKDVKINVAQRPLTVTADAKTKAYGDLDPALTYQITSGSLVAGDSFTGTLTRDSGENVGTYAIKQGTLTLGANYDLTFVGADLTITKRPVTVTADAKSKVYGDSDPVLTYQITSGSLVAGDTFTGALTRDLGEAVGTYAIKQGTLALSNNYQLTFIGANLTITKRPVTVTADAKSKVYGDSDPALTYQITSGSLVTGDSFTGALTRDPGEAVATYAIKQGTLALDNNYQLTFIGANLTITKRPVTVTADAKTKVYGNTDPALTYQLTSGTLVTGDAFTGALSRVAGENVGTYAIQQGTLTLGANYVITFIGADLTITSRPVTVTADAKTKIYGNADPALTYQLTYGTLVTGDTFTGALSRVAGENVGTYAIQQGTLALGANYVITFIGADLTITPRPVTVTADAKTKVYGNADPALTYQLTYGTLVPGDTFTGALTRVAGENVGTYSIQQGTLALGTNYVITFIGADFTITARPVTVSADAKTKVYGAADPALTYQLTYGALVTGDTFSGALTRAPGENVGTYAIQQGTLTLGSNYVITFIGANLTITARPVTVTADGKTKVYGAADPALTYQLTYGALVTGDTFSGALTRAPSENAGTYAIQQGTLALGTNYVITFIGANLTITARPVTVTADGKTKVYGAADPALTYQLTYGALVTGDTFSGALTRAPGENAGTYAIQQGTLTLGANYVISFIGANLTITARPITVTADPKTKVYGNPDPALTYQLTSGSLVSGDGFAGALTRLAGENVGPYAIQQGTLTAGANYNLTFIGASLTIAPRSITIKADAKSKNYGFPDPPLTYQITVGSLVNGDSFSGALTRVAGESAGVYAILQGTVALSSNYALSYVGADLQILSWWTLAGFYNPVDMGGVWNTVKGGSTVPLKFEVFAGPTELTDTSLITLTATPVNCGSGLEDSIEVTATGGTALRYDSTSGQFIFNWQTPKLPGRCYDFRMTTADGSSIVGKFKLK